MNYYSLNNAAVKVDFEQATIQGQAKDKGLYFPEQIPSIDQELLSNIEQLSHEEIAMRVIQPYVGKSIPNDVLQQIATETVDFPFPLVPIAKNISSLELFHGPTMAFKDVGARFMSRCLGYFVRNNDRKITVLVATSGDTGGAVANGFYNVQGVDVVILYPSGKVSEVQEQQLTTLGNNISALEVDGTFDDCQRLVKQAFADQQLNEQIFLTSANSINVARWLPQQFYYFFAWKAWSEKKNPPVISVPSGNFGNICAGLLARQSGLPIDHFIAACNSNDVVSAYLDTGKYTAKITTPTISNAMDVGDPSNFVRVLRLFDDKYMDLKKVLGSITVSDDETRQTITEIYSSYKYILDPHGAVGYLALQKYLADNPQKQGFFLETAHPVKFYDVVAEAIGRKIELPEVVSAMQSKQKHRIKIEAKYSMLENFLLMRQ